MKRMDRRLAALALGVSTIVVAIVGTTAVAQTAAEVAKGPVVPPKPARLPDGYPNWTGFWVPTGGMLEHDIGLGGTPVVDGAPATLPGQTSPTAGVGVALPPPPGAAPPPGAVPPPGAGGPPSGGLSNGPPAALAPFADFPPLKSPYKENLMAFMMKAMKTGEVSDPVARCLPPGMPRVMTMVYGMEILQTPKVIAITSEWQAENRRVWMDRKNHPPADELDPTYNGDSIGHWEGDTLVIDTVGVREDVPLNYTGLMHGPKLHIIERLTQTSPGILTDEFTIDDPDVFVKPWIHKETYRHRPDLRIQEYICEENNRNVGAEGEATFKK